MVHIQKSGKSPNLLSRCIQWFCYFCDDTPWRVWLLCVVWDVLWLQTEIIIEKEESKEEITLHNWYMYLPDIQIKSGLFFISCLKMASLSSKLAISLLYDNTSFHSSLDTPICTWSQRKDTRWKRSHNLPFNSTQNVLPKPSYGRRYLLTS